MPIKIKRTRSLTDNETALSCLVDSCRYMSPHDMWNLCRDYQPGYYYYYCEFLERELGWNVINLYEPSEISREWGQFVDIEDDGYASSEDTCSDEESTVLTPDVVFESVDDYDSDEEDGEVYFDARSPPFVIDLTCDSDDETVVEPSPQRPRLN